MNENYEQTKEEKEIKYKEEHIKYNDEVKEMNGTLRITIPKKEAEFLGIKTGDEVRIWIKKLTE